MHKRDIWRRDVARRYVLGDTQSENAFINCMRFSDIYFICTTLLVMIHILNTQKWAPGHTVPGATTRINAYTIKKYIQHFKYKSGLYHFPKFINAVICEEFSMRNAYDEIF